jgi:NADH-quinone oxidoreductase subunit L
MQQSLWLIPVFPLAGFVLLALFGSRLNGRGTALIGVGSVGLSAIACIIFSVSFMVNPPAVGFYTSTLWTWMDTAGFSPGISLYLDAPAVIMILVIGIVGFLIHLYSAGFMAAERGYSRFFAYMNLFVGSMLILVLADNLLLLYLGWEGVGLCSYLLIGFWYGDSSNVRAADKAFIVTRIGDSALAAGLLLLFWIFGTLSIQEILSAISSSRIPENTWLTMASILILVGAVAKSAQLPLQIWLPDAMAGPTPVSGLIHAATMVAAGVYLIMRMNILYLATPAVMTAIGVIGLATLLVGALSALTQTDIKRTLAWSTISQIGYMFFALGVGAWSAALFHFMTHAFFKALLFLCVGAVIQALDGEHNIFKMGGLRTRMPLVFWSFLAGAASLSAIPLITAGFYSKDFILYLSWTSVKGSPWLWAGGLVGSFLTALYAFRLFFLVFFGSGPAITKMPGLSIRIPLILLAVFSIFGGFVQLPRELGGFAPFSEFVRTGLPSVNTKPIDTAVGSILFIDALIAPIAGAITAWYFYIRKPALSYQWSASVPGSLLSRFWQSGWGFDAAYRFLFVRPYLWFCRVNRNDIIDSFYNGLAGLNIAMNQVLVLTQSGKLRRYAAVMTAGAIIMIGVIILTL